MQNVPESPESLRQRALAGDALAMYQLGVLYRNGSGGLVQSNEQALHWYTQSARAGHIQAMLQLAAVYTLGRLAPTDHTEAAGWLRKAANLGHAHAMHLLALKLASGRDVPQDLAEAVNLYHRAANLGHSGAMFELAMAYDSGLPNLPADGVLARRWMERAREAGETAAARVLEEWDARLGE